MTALNTVNDVVIGLSPDGRIIDWNAAAGRILGLNEPESRGKPLDELVAFNGGDLAELVRRGEPREHLEVTLRGPDAHTTHLAGTLTPVIAAKGQPIGAFLVGRVVTGALVENGLQHVAQRRAQLRRELPPHVGRLLPHSGLMAELLADLPAGLAFLGTDMVFKLVNPNYAAVFGQPPEYFVGKNFLELFPEAETKLGELIQRMLTGPRGSQFSYSGMRLTYEGKGGPRQTYWDFTYAPVWDETGHLEGILVLCFEVSERVRLEQQVAQHAQALEEAQLLAHIGNWEHDLVTGQITGSQEFMRLYGFAPDTPTVTLAQILERLAPEDRQRFDSDLTAWSEGMVKPAERRLILPGGEERFLLVYGKPLTNGEGELVKLFGVVHDVTELRRNARMKDEFVSTVSHELRTPLAALRGTLHLLVNGVVPFDSPQSHDLLAILDRNTQRLVTLVDDLLDYQRLATGRLELTLEAVSVRSLMDQATELVALLARDAGVTLSSHITDGTVLADGSRIVQVLTNLLDNAIAVSPRGSTVRLEVEPQGGAMCFRVADEGPGVPEDQLETIFEPFHRLGGDTQKKDGVGLGLAISRRIVEQHHGRIWASRNPDRGSTLSFTLPTG